MTFTETLIEDAAKRAAEITAEETARAVVAELVRAGKIINREKLGTFKKVERVLYMFPSMREDAGDETAKLYRQIRLALNAICDDPYFELIQQKYFYKWTHERSADYFGVDEKTIRYQRNKLIDKLRPLIFSDEYLREMILDL